MTVDEFLKSDLDYTIEEKVFIILYVSKNIDSFMIEKKLTNEVVKNEIEKARQFGSALTGSGSLIHYAEQYFKSKNVNQAFYSDLFTSEPSIIGMRKACIDMLFNSPFSIKEVVMFAYNQLSKNITSIEFDGKWNFK